MRGWLVAPALLLLLTAIIPAVNAGSGIIYLNAAPVVVGNTVPCDSATYTMGDAVSTEGKAYTARSFGASACSTYMDLTVAQAFKATAPITIRGLVGCDTPSVSAGVAGATTSMRYTVFHDSTAVSSDINLVGSNACTPGTPLIYQTNVDLKGEEFKAGDVLRVRAIPFYTTPGAGDPGKSLHLITGPTGTIVTIPDLASSAAPKPNATSLPILYQNTSTSELKAGRVAAANLTQTEVYNWTAPNGTLELVGLSQGNGSVAVRLTDGANATVYNHTFNGTTNQTKVLAGKAGPGWSMRLEYQSFTGNFSVSVRAVNTTAANGTASSSSSSSGTTTGSSSATDSTTADNATATEDAEKGSPGLPLPLLAVAITAFAVAIRRRRFS